jgi:hypothetical protein
MHRQATRSKRGTAVTARRILQQLFETHPAPVDASRALADFEGCRLAGTAQALTPMGWRILVKERVYSCFGVSCDIDEPLSALAARIELAERGVSCSEAG